MNTRLLGVCQLVIEEWPVRARWVGIIIEGNWGVGKDVVLVGVNGLASLY